MNSQRMTRSPRLLPSAAARRRRLGVATMLIALMAALNARADANTDLSLVCAVPAVSPLEQAVGVEAVPAMLPAARQAAATGERPKVQPAGGRFGLALALGLLVAAVLRGFAVD